MKLYLSREEMLAELVERTGIEKAAVKSITIHVNGDIEFELDSKTVVTPEQIAAAEQISGMKATVISDAVTEA